MKALLYSLTLLLFSLSVEAAERPHQVTVAHQTGVEVAMLPQVPEPVLSLALDSSALPVAVASQTSDFHCAPELVPVSSYHRQSPIRSSIRAPPAVHS